MRGASQMSDDPAYLAPATTPGQWSAPTPVAVVITILALLFAISHLLGRKAEAEKLALAKHEADREATKLSRVSARIVGRAARASEERRAKRQDESSRGLEEDLTQDAVRQSWKKRQHDLQAVTDDTTRTAVSASAGPAAAIG